MKKLKWPFWPLGRGRGRSVVRSGRESRKISEGCVVWPTQVEDVLLVNRIDAVIRALVASQKENERVLEEFNEKMEELYAAHSISR